MWGFGKQNLDDKLLKAAAIGDVSSIKALLDRGADIEVRAKKDQRLTVLGSAAYNGHVEAVRLLLDRGANIEARSEGQYDQTPLNIAAIKGQLGVLRLLLDRGADIEARDKDGDAPLINSTRGKNTAATKELLNRGADKTATNHQGKTAAGLALEEGRKEFYHLLGIDTPAPAAAPKTEMPLPAAENPDEVVFFRRHGNRVLEETFNFAVHERITLLRNGMDGPVEAMTRDSFDNIGDKAALRHAFEIYQSKGGKLPESEVLPNTLGKPKLSGVQA